MWTSLSSSAAPVDSGGNSERQTGGAGVLLWSVTSAGVKNNIKLSVMNSDVKVLCDIE